MNDLDEIIVGANKTCDTEANSSNVSPINVPPPFTLQEWLDKTCKNQANIHLTVSPGLAPLINYDLDRSGGLIYKYEGEVNPAEYFAISEKATTVSAHFHICYLRRIDQPDPNKNTAGMAVEQLRTAFVQDEHRGDTGNVSAHEIGHLLGFDDHVERADSLMYPSFNGNKYRIGRREWRIVNGGP